MTERHPEKPCPFCAGAPIVEPISYDQTGEVGIRAFWVQCGECVAAGPWGDTPEEAVEKWDRRA